MDCVDSLICECVSVQYKCYGNKEFDDIRGPGGVAAVAGGEPRAGAGMLGGVLQGEDGNGGGAAVCRGGFGGAMLRVDRLYRQKDARWMSGAAHLTAPQEQPLDGAQHPTLPRTGTPRADDRRWTYRLTPTHNNALTQ